MKSLFFFCTSDLSHFPLWSYIIQSIKLHLYCTILQTCEMCSKELLDHVSSVFDIAVVRPYAYDFALFFLSHPVIICL